MRPTVIFDLDLHAPGEGWAVGASGRLHRIQNNAWEMWAIEPSWNLAGVYSSGPDDAWVVGANASVRHWDGATWSPVDVPHNVNVVPALQAVDGNGPDNVWIVGQNGTVLHWDGSVWEELDPPLQDEDFSVVDVDDAGDVWTSRALPSRLYRYHAGGWLIRPLPLHILLYATTEASDNSRWWLGSRLIEVWH